MIVALLQLVIVVLAGYRTVAELDLVFMHQPIDVEIFEGNSNTVTFLCNASSNGSRPVYYRWYHKPTNGTYRRLEDAEANTLLITRPVMADSGYYLCQAYNHEGSIQSTPAELVVLGASTIQSRIIASFSVLWFTMNDGTTEGSGYDRVNITDNSTIQSALETVLNSSLIRVVVVDVDTSVVASEITAEIFGICSNCNLVNDSLDTIEDEIMNWQQELYNLVEYIQQNIVNREFIVAASSEAFVRMRITAANSSDVIISCPPAMTISNNSFFICVNCAPGNYFRSSTCAPCELNHFQDQQGQKSCQPCPGGSMTDGIGARTLKECIFPGPVREPSTENDNAAAIAATVTIVVILAILIVGILLAYLWWRRGHRKYNAPVMHGPTIILENSSVLPASFPTDEDDNISEIPTIRYVKPAEVDVESATHKSSRKKLRKKQKSEEIVKLPKEIEPRSKSFSSSHCIKRNHSSSMHRPSFYPIGEYTGPLSDQEGEGDMYDVIASPSNSGRRRSMSVSDLSRLALSDDKNDTQLHVSSFLSRLHAKHEPHYQPPKPSSVPIEMDKDMSDLYDSTLKSSARSQSYNATPSIRLSGLNISLGKEPVVGRRVHNSRPVTKYENSEVIQKFRESLKLEAPEDIQPSQPSQIEAQPTTGTLGVPQLQKDEESPYVTMKSVKKQSLPDLHNYKHLKKTKKSISVPTGPIFDDTPIKQQNLGAQEAKPTDRNADDNAPTELDTLVPPPSIAIRTVTDSEAQTIDT